MASGRARHLVPLGLFTVLQGLSSGYYAVATAVALGLAGVAMVAGTPRRRLLKVAGTLLVAGAVIFAGFMPYRATQRRYGFYRSRAECAHWSAGWRSYLDPGELAPLPHLRWLRDRTMTGEPLYPGTPILILAVAGAALARRVRPARLALLWTVAGVLLSLGPDVHLGRVVVPGPFDALRAIPAVQMLRTPARLGVIALVGMGLLAAAACAALRRRAGVARHLPAVLILVAVVEATSPGVGRLFRPIPPPPPTVAWLASAPRAPVLELPWSDAGDGATYAYWSTGHWQPMVNGWGAVEPPGNLGFGLIGGRFPAPYATALLQEHGIVYLVVHVDRLDPGQRGRVLGATALPPGVTLEVDFGADRIYRIDGPRPD
jgi:hypothetical protein